MVYGRLADPDHEFFVQRLDTSDQRSVEESDQGG